MCSHAPAGLMQQDKKGKKKKWVYMDQEVLDFNRCKEGLQSIRVHVASPEPRWVLQHLGIAQGVCRQQGGLLTGCCLCPQQTQNTPECRLQPYSSSWSGMWSGWWLAVNEEEPIIKSPHVSTKDSNDKWKVGANVNPSETWGKWLLVWHQGSRCQGKRE